MFRPAVGTLIIAATLGMAGQAAAELPMSPVFRADQAAASGQSPPRPGEHATPVNAASQGTAAQSPQTAAPKPEKRTAADAKAADSRKVVATALIPPPLPPPAAEPPTMPSAAVPTERAAAPPPKLRHAARPHYAYSRYRYFYPYYRAGIAGGPARFGPNPYSPNGD